MNILITILVVLLGLIILLLIIGMFTKKKYGVECEIIINKPKNEVFNYIKALKNQDYYSKWATMDLNMKKEYIGTDGTVGFVSAWESQDKNVGKGEQEITNIIENERIDFDLRFIKPFKSQAKVYMSVEGITEQNTKVFWGFKSKFQYPLNLMLLFMNMEKFIGRDFDYGLNKLKENLETK